MRRPKPGWLVLGVVAAGLLGWWGMPRALRSVSFFRVRRVELAGARYTAVRDVVRALALPHNSSVFLDTAPLAVRVQALPGLETVRITRRLPGTLRVEVRERVPVALTPKADGLTLMDSGGTLLAFDPVDAAPNLPIASPDARVARVLARVREADPELFQSVVSAERRGTGVLLRARAGRRVLLPADVTPEVLAALRWVQEDLAGKGRAYQELDGRFAGRILVRGGTT